MRCARARSIKRGCGNRRFHWSGLMESRYGMRLIWCWIYDRLLQNDATNCGDALRRSGQRG
jgi:hypothetical protein